MKILIAQINKTHNCISAGNKYHNLCHQTGFATNDNNCTSFTFCLPCSSLTSSSLFPRLPQITHSLLASNALLRTSLSLGIKSLMISFQRTSFKQKSGQSYQKNRHEQKNKIFDFLLIIGCVLII